MFRLDGKIALVTGASQGLGRTAALKLAGQGAALVLAARQKDKLAALAEEIAAAGGRAHVLELDLSKPEAVPAALASLPADFAGVDILVNNAGITRDGLFMRMSLEQWKEVIDTNLTGSFAVTRELIRGMMKKRAGRVIFVSSVIGLMGNAGQANYAAAKAGMIGLAKSLARELGSRGITVNVVAPGFIETAMTAELDEKVRQGIAENIVLRRFGTPDDIAAAVVYLASDEASYVTGHVLNVSGGMYI
jgi:3-oxoacyl-[acyl-carrier protein] reductase